MATPLLQTKLYAPRRRRGHVPRPRLAALLDRGFETKLTLVSAPPGFGKSTLLADRLEALSPDGPRTAWLSLDAADSDPGTFWNYVIAALQTAVPEVGVSARSILDTGQPATNAALASLLNDLVAIASDVVLVLDDYHVIEAREIHEAMTFLLDRLPPRVHLVIAARADPALPLARLRSRGELVEIRAAELRFTPDEAAAYLNGPMGLALTAHDVDALEGRTEGWIAALQLAALSIQGRDDAAGFIAGFTGDDRYIVDYLVEEVLHRQPETISAFLLQTSILERLTGPLCDAVTGQDGGRATLDALDRGNLFLVPLDDRRRWYRYHHLFADVLRARLLEEDPAQVPELHLRAAEWLAASGDRVEAIRHALAGGHAARAADLIELAIPQARRDRHEALMRGWLEALPEEVILARPVLTIGYVGALMSTGELEGIEPFLAAAERSLESSGARPPGMVVVDEEEFRALPGGIAMHRAAQALASGDVPGTMRYAHRALDVIGDDDYRRGAAFALLGLASWSSADLEAAYRAFAEGMASLDRAGFAADVVGGAIVLGDLRVTQGRLGDALRLYEDGLARAVGSGPAVLRGAADMHVGIADIFRERGDLAGAVEHLLASRQLGEGNGLPRYAGRFRIAMARVRRAEGDLDAAAALLAEAKPVFVTDYSPNVRPIEAQIALMDVVLGRLEAARAWAQARGLSAADDADFLHEFEHLVLARLLIADGHAGAAVALADRLLAAAEAGERLGSVLEILVVRALALGAADDAAGAFAALDRAFAIAEPEGYVQVFLDEGPSMSALLELAAKRADAPGYARRLLVGAPSVVEAPPVRRPLVRQPLDEPLSDRELDVLRLLQGDLDGPEMASALFVSLNTLRTHTKRIYAKLGVTSRRRAVTRAEELGLLPRR